MTDYSDVDAKIEEYGEIFDFYIEGGEMPPYAQNDNDPLVGYIQQVIDENPQIDSSDQTWVEVLKEGLLEYLEMLVIAFAEIQEQAQPEFAMIAGFAGAGIEGKFGQWGQVKAAIEGKYSKYQVDMAGFEQQLETAEPEAVMLALAEDWKDACEKYCEQRQMQVFQRSKEKWKQHIKEIGNTDYEERRRVAGIVYKNKDLKEIVELIGSEKESRKEEDNIIYAYLPQGARNGLPSEEIDRVETGDDIRRTLAAEFAMPDDIFYQKYVLKELQQLATLRNRSYKKTEQHNPKPRPNKGPIIVGVDTSGSMQGKPERIAKALLAELVNIAKRQRRSCYLIAFSVRIKTMDLGKRANKKELKRFLDSRFSGGTNPEDCFKEAIRMLETNEYEMADVLIISDFEMYENRDDFKCIAEAQKLGTRFYGLQIGAHSTAYDSAMDRKWKI